ncbi:Transporter [Vibrio chagasii]|uniref:ComEA family DNA-binding protein n=1 Tax=Vibrio TaxID=662 RepID=UPI0014937AA0|nr:MULTISPECIES: helix-hairpin-helix domain-containing protein [unclassified Vibrio]CAH6803840.1 Helix-hairpin-helix domain-containing protein [Vibrio chagasii]MDA0151568.1 helix-hairpin-helix domain-containing protein [Vibrio sp. Makdt]NOI87654.1 helix-hairpin-helix domain-containing protein [Vibrio sp. 99K-1]CAH6859604.1 Transporter [Vibrio chagasii]CAH6875981.1 Transporter [Vibrio chagasii]
MRTLYSTLLLSLLMFLSPTALADSPTKAELYDGIEVTVNINTATAEELSALLVGVGDKKAKDIVDYRTENGAFASADDLVSVKGIGEATVEKNRERIQL